MEGLGVPDLLFRIKLKRQEGFNPLKDWWGKPLGGNFPLGRLIGFNKGGGLLKGGLT